MVQVLTRRMWYLLKRGGIITFCSVSACLLIGALLCQVAPPQVTVQLGLALGCQLGSGLLPEDSFQAQTDRQQPSDGMLFLRPWRKNETLGGTAVVQRHPVCLPTFHWLKQVTWLNSELEGGEVSSCLGRGRQGVNSFEQQPDLPQEALNSVWWYISCFFQHVSSHAVSDISEVLRGSNVWTFNMDGQANRIWNTVQLS